MDFVCDVPYDGSEFFYHEGQYIRKKGEKVLSKISSKNLPDPFVLWDKRCKFNCVMPNSDKGYSLKPNDVTFKLWEYHNANANH